eukprot:CAMPEP_0168182740 /NCGR_PEP_ID=MMETSP0139_2-20121125/12056_1 /TAXON_ID=44445 /ORGANISM="Pseudo-nitzschia australis, Strain 10249 10 AB" /LENGTH=616 /DNA_ID=CAMNT_0008103693 /DNA_START=54 /DNA_END=1904 /DNA_ORIENTATION=+
MKMNFGHIFIQLFVGLLGMVSISHAQELGPVQCPAPEPDEEIEKCSKEFFDKFEADHQDSLTELESVYDNDCDDKEPSDSEYKGCVALRDTICDLTTDHERTKIQLEKSCKKAEENKAISESAFVALAALGPETPFKECKTTETAEFKRLAEVEADYQTAITALSFTKDQLERGKDSADSIPLFGSAIGAGISVVIVVLEAVMLVLENLKVQLKKDVKNKELDDGVCTGEYNEYMKDIALEAFDVIEDNQLILDFLSCPVDEEVTFVGGGCDGIDNDCDSTILDTFGPDRTDQTIVKRTDECDEDLVPPTITLVKEPPQTFQSQQVAETWYMENTIVSDDCAPLARLNKYVVNAGTAGEVAIKVVDTRCENKEDTVAVVNGVTRIVDGPGQPSATSTFAFVVDGDAPTVACGFYKPQDINYFDGTGKPQEATGDRTDPLFIDFLNEKMDLVNVKFWYQMQENPPNPGEKLDVEIVVTSNEYEGRDGRQMLDMIEKRNLGGPPAPVRRLTLLLAPFTCRDNIVDKVKNSCLVEKYTTARFYDIHVVATDTSGNKGDATCTVAAIPEYYPTKTSKKGARGASATRALASAKGYKGAPRATRKELLLELAQSEQRYLLQ